MYSQRTTFFPAMGKGPELRPILEEIVKRARDQGARNSLSTAAFGADGPCFAISRQFDDLAALEAMRANPAGPDPRVAPLTRQTVRAELFEILVAPPQSSAPVKYLQRVTTTPAAGKGREVRELIIERAKARQAEGARFGASVQAAGPAAGTFATITAFESLVEFEKQRARNQTDTAFQQYAARLGGLTSGPPVIELFEILIPYQARP